MGNRIHTTAEPQFASLGFARQLHANEFPAWAQSSTRNEMRSCRRLYRAIHMKSAVSRCQVPILPSMDRRQSFLSSQTQPEQQRDSFSATSGVTLDNIRDMEGFIIDMDGVLYHGNKLLNGALEFVDFLQQQKKEFLFLTNSSDRTPEELKEKLARLGIEADVTHFYTSALATAAFMAKQMPKGGSAYVIGDAGLIYSICDAGANRIRVCNLSRFLIKHAGFTMNDHTPDYVVVGETRNFHFEQIEKAVHLVRNGARLLGTNVDAADRMHDSLVPGCGSLIKPIELVAGVEPYFVGKPNPMMMRTAMNRLKTHRSKTVVIGDRMNTDILGGLQAELTTCLVLTGVATLEELPRFPYRPDIVLPAVGYVAPNFNASS